MIGKDHAKKLHLLELERWRTNDCEHNGKKYLYKASSILKDENSGGTATCSLILPRCPLYVSIQCYSTTPYSIYLGSKQSPTIRIDFQPRDLCLMICCITKVVGVNEHLVFPDYFDVLVWGGKETIRITRVVDDKEDTPPEEYLGIRITQINSRMVKKRASDLGVNERFLAARSLAGDGLFVSHLDVGRLMHLLVKANEAVQLQCEIRAQNYATFQIASRRANENPGYSREDYYWYVLDAFYALKVKEKNKLPAYYVLRLFMKSYLCEIYSLY